MIAGIIRRVDRIDYKEADMAGKALSSNELATILNTDPRTCRRFLRKQFPSLAGQPGNWEIDTELLEELKKAWQALHPQPQHLRDDSAHKKTALV